MRVVIEIDGDKVTVHHSGEAMPPPELLERAAALGAESAGGAPVLGAEASLASLGEDAIDAGAAAKAPGGPRAPAAAARPRRRSSRRAR